MLNVFYQGTKRHEWSAIPADRIESFFRTVSLILANQLRMIVQRSLNDFISLFHGDTSAAAKRFENGQPVSFVVRLVLDDTKLTFDPSFKEILSTIDGLLDSLLVTADRVPKIETQLFSTGQSVTSTRAGIMNLKPEQCIRVAFAETFPTIVEEARTTLKDTITKRLQNPQSYQQEFDKHKVLVTKDAERTVTSFLAGEPTAEQMMQVLSRLTKMREKSSF